MTDTEHAEPGRGRCALHPDREALGLCQRCGSFFCDACFKDLAGKRLCTTCLELPGIDYIAETRRKLGGKRDGFVWYLGLIGSLGTLTTLWFQVAAEAWLRVAAESVTLGLSVSYFLLRPWARAAIFATAPLAVISPVGNDSTGAAVAALVTLLLCFAAWFSTRNKLAFRAEVSDAQVQRVYDQYLSNPNAMRALVYSVLGLLVPLLGLLSLALGIQALRKVQRTTWPPVGGRRAALTSIALSLVGLVTWIGLGVALLLS